MIDPKVWQTIIGQTIKQDRITHHQSRLNHSLLLICKHLYAAALPEVYNSVLLLSSRQLQQIVQSSGVGHIHHLACRSSIVSISQDSVTILQPLVELLRQARNLMSLDLEGTFKVYDIASLLPLADSIRNLPHLNDVCLRGVPEANAVLLLCKLGSKKFARIVLKDVTISTEEEQMKVLKIHKPADGPPLIGLFDTEINSGFAFFDLLSRIGPLHVQRWQLAIQGLLENNTDEAENSLARFICSSFNADSLEWMSIHSSAGDDRYARPDSLLMSMQPSPFVQSRNLTTLVLKREIQAFALEADFWPPNLMSLDITGSFSSPYLVLERLQGLSSWMPKLRKIGLSFHPENRFVRLLLLL